MTIPHDPEHTSPSSTDDETTPLPPFVFVPEHGGVPPVAGQIPMWDESSDAGQPADQEPLQPRRWSRGHTIAAAAVAVGVLVSGGFAAGAHYSDSTSTAASGQPPVGPNGAQQQPAPGQGQQPGQDPLASLGQLDVGQLDGLLNQLSDGQLDSDQLRALLNMLGLPDHLDARQLQDLLQQLGGGDLLGGAGDDDSSGTET